MITNYTSHNQFALLMGASLVALAAIFPAYAHGTAVDQPRQIASAAPEVVTRASDADAAFGANVSVERDSGTDILVTARRREERVQDVPIAIGVIGGKTLQDSGAYTINQLQQLTPNLLVVSFNPRNTNINIRGLGANVATANDGLENGVGVYVDQVYMGRVGLSQFELTDLERIEVLRGPQGTLFGKNTTAGAINITSRKPSFEPEAWAEASLGDYSFHQVKASLSGPLIDDKLAARISIADTHRDGFVRNVRTGKDLQDFDNFTVRGQLLFRPTPDVDIRIIGDYGKQTLKCCINVIAGQFDARDNGVPVPRVFLSRAAEVGYTPVPFDPFARKTDVDSDVRAKMQQWGVSAQADWDVGPAILTSITAYRHWDWYPANDADLLGLPIIVKAEGINHQRQFSQEVRLASSGSRRLDYVVGAFYFWQVVDGIASYEYGPSAPRWYLPATTPAAIGNAALNGFKAAYDSSPTTHSLAAFGQLVWHITDDFSLTGGLRYTHERKRGTFHQYWTGGADLSLLPAAAAAAAAGIRNGFNPETDYSTAFTDDSVSGLLTAAYKFSPVALGYLTYARGSKSGGLNLTSLPPGVDPVVDPEQVDHFEAGLKTQWFNRTLTFNTSLFWTVVSNYQSAVAQPNAFGSGFLQYIDNIKKARSRGAEIEAQWQLNDRWSIVASGALTDAKYLSYENGQCPVEISLTPARCDLTGKQMSGVAKWSGSVAVNGSAPISKSVELYGRVDYGLRSGVYTAVSNSRYSRIPGYGLANLRIGIRDGERWDLSVWARNLFDKNYFQTRGGNNAGLISGVIGDPRTIGATIRRKF